MTMKLWELQVVGIYVSVVKYHGNQWWNVLTKAGTDGQKYTTYGLVLSTSIHVPQKLDNHCC